MKSSIGALLFFMMLVSCAKEEPAGSTKVVPEKPNIQIVLTAKHVYSVQPYADKPLKGVDVHLYNIEYDRIHHESAVKWGTTDSLGRVHFEFLNKQVYYAEATYPGMDTERITINYAAGAIVSYEDLLMIIP